MLGWESAKLLTLPSRNVIFSEWMLPTMLLYDQLWKILCLWNQVVSIYVLLFFNQEHFMESLFLENRFQDSRRRSFCSQRDITGRTNTVLSNVFMS